MAKYRPKSLDELNSFYGESLTVQNSIKESASAISSKALSDESADSSKKIDEFFAEHGSLSSGGCADLTEDIQKFIRDFGKPATAEDEIAIRRHRPVPIKLRQLPTVPKSVEPAEKATEAEAQPSVRETKPEKTEFIITAEKNELFEEYMRIMADEDDEDDSRSRRKRKKNKKTAEAEAPKAETPVAEDDTDFTDYTAPAYETYEAEETESFSSFAEENEEAPIPSEEKKPLSLTEDKDSPFSADDEDEDEEAEKKEQPRKKTALQLMLFLLLFVTLLSALTVTAVQTLIKVNSGEMFMNKYYAYSAEFTDRVTDINEGDLVLVEAIPTENNDVFAYSTANGISYAVQTFSGEPERTSGKNGISDTVTVLNTSIKGKVTRIFPSIGKGASAISENFMTVITGLLVLAVVIILLLIFAFRRTSSKSKTAKDNFSFDEQEDFDEASDEDFSLT